MIRYVLILAVIAGAIAFPHLLTSNYFIHLAILAMIWMIVAQGANVIQGYTGYVSIAQAGFMGIGAYSSALLSIEAGFPVWIAILVSPLFTAVASLIAGYPSLRVKGHYFAIVSSRHIHNSTSERIASVYSAGGGDAYANQGRVQRHHAHAQSAAHR